MELVRLSARANDLFMAASPWRATRPQPFFFFVSSTEGETARRGQSRRQIHTWSKARNPPRKKKQKQILIAYSEIKNKKTIMKRLEYHLI